MKLRKVTQSCVKLAECGGRSGPRLTDQFARHRHRYKHKKIPGTMKSPRDSNLIALALLLVATLLVVYLL